jgi:hypothetical protein
MIAQIDTSKILVETAITQPEVIKTTLIINEQVAQFFLP